MVWSFHYFTESPFLNWALKQALVFTQTGKAKYLEWWSSQIPCSPLQMRGKNKQMYQQTQPLFLSIRAGSKPWSSDSPFSIFPLNQAAASNSTKYVIFACVNLFWNLVFGEENSVLNVTELSAGQRSPTSVPLYVPSFDQRGEVSQRDSKQRGTTEP